MTYLLRIRNYVLSKTNLLKSFQAPYGRGIFCNRCRLQILFSFVPWTFFRMIIHQIFSPLCIFADGKGKLETVLDLALIEFTNL